MIAYYGAFSTGYLLALAPTTDPAADTNLAAYLTRAYRSGKPAVWVDCRLLDSLPAPAAQLLGACQQQLRRRHARLVFCQVPAAVEHTLRSTLSGQGADLVIVPTLDNAMALA